MAAVAADIAQDDIHAGLLTGHTGVRITGVPVTDMSDAQVEEAKRLISTYCVGVFPGQFLGPEDQVRFVARFDPITFTPGEDEHPDWPKVHVCCNAASRPRA